MSGVALVRCLTSSTRAPMPVDLRGCRSPRPLLALRMPRGRRERGAALGLALTLCAPVPSATAGGPEDAAQAREGIVETVEMLPPGAAVERLATEGYRLKDPLLLLESAERALARAEASTDEGPLLEALPHVAVALDMLHFLGSDRSRKAWRPVAPEDVEAAIARAEASRMDSGAMSFPDFRGLPGDTSHHASSRSSARIAASVTPRWPRCAGLNDPPSRPVRVIALGMRRACSGPHRQFVHSSD